MLVNESIRGDPRTDVSGFSLASHAAYAAVPRSPSFEEERPNPSGAVLSQHASADVVNPEKKSK